MSESLHSQALQPKERDYWFDNAKAILIVFVVIAHLAEVLITTAKFEGGVPLWLNTLYKGIYIFHMPVFIIISGRFAKKRIDSNDYPAVVNKLVLPYLLVQTIMMVFYSFTGYSSVSGFSYLSPYFGLWYLITIAVYQLITPHLKKVKGLFWLSLLVAIGMQFGSAVPKGGFMRLFTYYPFFLFGYYTSAWDLKVCRKAWFRILSAAAFAVMFAVVWMLPQYFKVGALTLKRVYSDVVKFFPDMDRLEFLLFTCAHYLAGFACFFFLVGISPTKKRVFSRLGSQSNYIYVLHLFLIVFCKALDKHYNTMDVFGTALWAVIILIMAIPLCFLLTSEPVKRWTRWLVAPDFDLKRIIKRLTEK